MAGPSETKTPDLIHRDEAAFHDKWADDTDLSKINVDQAFTAPTAVENRFILKQLGNLTGLKILDVGTGLGESAVYFAKCGAHVTATDLSPGMIETVNRLAALHGVHVDTVVTAAEVLDVPAETFDVVYVANTLHHVTDKRALLLAARRALRPGGRFFSWDPLAYNPVIGLYRRMATEVRTADERPLKMADVKLIAEIFSGVKHREFQIATLAIFLKYFLFDRVHPNQDRYWKRILIETNESLWWWWPLRGMDAVLTRLPGLRLMAWNIVIWGRKSA